MALLFDLDGTLAEIVDHPGMAKIEPEVLQLLEGFRDLPRVAVGIISGRSLRDLKQKVGLDGLYYSGNCGMEIDLLGTHIVHPDAEGHRSALGQLVSCLSKVAERFPGAWVENKGLGITLHYRQTPIDRHLELQERAGRVYLEFATSMQIVEGRMAWEITPAVGWDKGSAVLAILESIGENVVSLYAGDSANDEQALAAVDSFGGIGIGVGPFAPASAHFTVKDPRELLSLLVAVAAALHGSELAATV